MKRLKNMIAVALCVTTLSILGGCGSKSTEESNEKVLRVGMECAYAPFNWTQKTNENGAVKIKGSQDYANGYDVMMAKKIAEKMGYKLEVSKIEWGELCPDVIDGKIDASIAGQSITAERLQTVDFSDPYYKADIVVLVKKGSPYENIQSIEELRGVTCTSQLGTVWYDMLEQIPNADIKEGRDTLTNLLSDLTSGKVSVIAVDKPTAMAAVHQNSDLVMIDLKGDKGFAAEDEDVNIGIALKKGNKQFKDQINKALSEITEEERNQIMNDAIKAQPSNIIED